MVLILPTPNLLFHFALCLARKVFDFLRSKFGCGKKCMIIKYLVINALRKDKYEVWTNIQAYNKNSEYLRYSNSIAGVICVPLNNSLSINLKS